MNTNSDPRSVDDLLQDFGRLGDATYDARRCAEIRDLVAEIAELKREKNAIVLAHNYQRPEIFEVADFVGDSLELARKAADVEAGTIVFCGVHFMAETAKILNPTKTVLLPNLAAGCSLADSITGDALAERREELRKVYPDLAVVTYVNTTADVKAESDICCTSSNAAAIVESCGTDTVIFIPDEYLARNVARETGKHIIFPTADPRRTFESDLDYQMIGWSGRCEVHEKFTVEDITAVRKQFPDVVILAHPECSPDVIATADFSGNTTAMTRFVERTKALRYLLLTECAMGDNVAAANPKKEMLRLCSIRCPHMNLITLENTLESLRKNQYVIEIDEEIRLRALRAVDRMISIG